MASLALTPRGHLRFTVADGPFQLPDALSRRLEEAFGRGSGHGLLELGAAEVGTALPADLSYWRDFAARLVTAICTHPDLDANRAPIPAPASAELDALALAAPPMTGAEYITASVLEVLWTETGAAFRSELAESKASVQEFLQRKSRSYWSTQSRLSAFAASTISGAAWRRHALPVVSGPRIGKNVRQIIANLAYCLPSSRSI